MKIDGYKFGQKNNWRRWAWNRICERLTIPKKEAIIVYLAGMEDLDRTVAVNNGFNPNNMIAVDKNSVVIENLKAKGALYINAEITDVLQCFRNTKIKIDILIGDFCCGLTPNIEKLSMYLSTNLMGESFNDNSIILLNLLRGREESEMLKIAQYDNKGVKHRGKLFIDFFLKMHSMINNVFLFNYFKSDENAVREWNELVVEDRKEIRKQVVEQFIQMLIDQGTDPNLNKELINFCLQKADEEFDKEFDKENTFNFVRSFEDIEKWIEKRTLSNLNPIFNSYKSGKLTMDSIIFSFSPLLSLSTLMEGPEEMKLKPIQYKLRSTLAIQTMRKNGTLASCPIS